MKIIDTKWFNYQNVTIGIVLIQGQINDHKAYIGLGDGANEGKDEMHIAHSGAPFHYGPALWPEIKNWRI